MDSQPTYKTEMERDGQTVFLRPSPMQFCIVQLHLIFLCVMALVVSVTAGKGFIATCCLVVFLGMLAFLICQAVHVSQIMYILTDEQLIYKHGVFLRRTDFMELYRIVDYQETRTLMQQMAGLKNVIIFSVDRNMPTLTLVGVLQNTDVITVLRRRVEESKRQHAVFENLNGCSAY